MKMQQKEMYVSEGFVLNTIKAEIYEINEMYV